MQLLGTTKWSEIDLSETSKLSDIWWSGTMRRSEIWLSGTAKWSNRKYKGDILSKYRKSLHLPFRGFEGVQEVSKGLSIEASGRCWDGPQN